MAISSYALFWLFNVLNNEFVASQSTLLLLRMVEIVLYYSIVRLNGLW